ncbi:hypothetical protein THASP1DRAFT_30930 [Thamnocephalis sphaerospora]|uniref:SET domain-containing protein n=1 Tax=Thamnocephalis sphaerospora TaxID=78915 RepID=A0A4P9XPA6_9FUNG|nr:hypothetical protein THASP1DRAFT_30930 [Thamnocephalis sphaerospora]|eukprot:RKP07261.1 hypothetical protein THASP1DRAFT_30930 [Thamnocephalis sphaerospora]
MPPRRSLRKRRTTSDWDEEELAPASAVPSGEPHALAVDLARLSFADEGDLSATTARGWHTLREQRVSSTASSAREKQSSTPSASTAETSCAQDAHDEEQARYDALLREAVAQAALAPVELRRLPGCGRGILAEAAIASGTAVLVESPCAAVLADAQLTTRCSRCFGADRTLRRCAGCRTLHYCSQTCQRADWHWHRRECKRLASASHRPPTVVRLAARILQQRQDEPEMYAQVEALESRILLLCAYKRSEETLKTYFKLSTLLGRDSGDMDLPASASELIRLWCQIGCNSHSVLDADLEDVGVALYPAAAQLNHACKPNCVLMFDGQTLLLRALHEIESGEEASDRLTINYVCAADTTAVRQRELRERYFFDCACSECAADAKHVDLREAVRCPNASCDATLARPANPPTEADVCAACGHAVDKDYTAQLFTVLHDIEKLESSSKAGVVPIDQSLQAAHRLCQQHLALTHHVYRRVLQQHFEQALNTENWLLAYTLATELETAYRTLYLDGTSLPPGRSIRWHPVVTTRLYAKAKLAELCAETGDQDIPRQSGTVCKGGSSISNAGNGLDTLVKDKAAPPSARAALILLRSTLLAARHTHTPAPKPKHTMRSSAVSCGVLARWLAELEERIRARTLLVDMQVARV